MTHAARMLIKKSNLIQTRHKCTRGVECTGKTIHEEESMAFERERSSEFAPAKVIWQELGLLLY